MHCDGFSAGSTLWGMVPCGTLNAFLLYSMYQNLILYSVMKNLTAVFLFISFLFSGCLSFAQTNNRAFNKGDFSVSLGYGIGNIWKGFLEDAISFPENYKVSSKGPVVLLIDYNIHRKINIGIATGYSETNGRYKGSGQDFSEKLTAFSALFRANWHFGNWEKWDLYAGGGAGYYHFNYSNNRNIIKPNSVPGSFGYSLQLGTSYYFSSHIGLYGEVGYIGGSLAQGGVKARF